MKTVLVLARKGGSGKTLLSNEIAYSLERSAIPFVFTQLDPQGDGAHAGMDNPENANYTIIDTPAGLHDDVLRHLDTADVIVVPTQAAINEMQSFQQIFDIIRQSAPATPVVVVVNRWTGNHVSSRQYTDWLKNEIRNELTLLRCVPETQAVARAGMEEMAVLRYAKRTRKNNAAKYLLSTINAVRHILGLPAEIMEDIK